LTIYLHVLLGLLSSSLSIPVLEVFVNGRLLGIFVLSHHGHEADSIFGGPSVHCLLEGGIAFMVLLLELGLGNGHCLLFLSM